jgi:hypothetical protein
MDLAIEAAEKIGRYFAGMVEARRADPDDVVSVIATPEVDGEYLPDGANSSTPVATAPFAPRQRSYAAV